MNTPSLPAYLPSLLAGSATMNRRIIMRGRGVQHIRSRGRLDVAAQRNQRSGYSNGTQPKGCLLNRISSEVTGSTFNTCTYKDESVSRADCVYDSRSYFFYRIVSSSSRLSLHVSAQRRGTQRRPPYRITGLSLKTPLCPPTICIGLRVVAARNSPCRHLGCVG
jgi:hypothetical protein